MAELAGNSKKIMDLVKELSIVELNDLVKAMEEEFGVSAAAPVMVAAAG
jgi:large subunit ribosomal protein L7/L12